MLRDIYSIGNAATKLHCTRLYVNVATVTWILLYTINGCNEEHEGPSAGYSKCPSGCNEEYEGPSAGYGKCFGEDVYSIGGISYCHCIEYNVLLWYRLFWAWLYHTTEYSFSFPDMYFCGISSRHQGTNIRYESLTHRQSANLCRRYHGRLPTQR